MAELSALATLESASPAGGDQRGSSSAVRGWGSAREPSLPTQQQFHLFVPYIRPLCDVSHWKSSRGPAGIREALVSDPGAYFSVTSERLKFSHLFASVVQASRNLMQYWRSSESAASSASVAHLAAVSQAVWLLLVISFSRLLCSKLLQCSSVSPVLLLLRTQLCPGTSDDAVLP
jgi:hypothetical protein